MDWKSLVRSGSGEPPNDRVALISKAIDHHHAAIGRLEKALDNIDAERQGGA